MARSANRRRIGFPGEQRLQHRPRGHAVEIGGDRGQFDPSVLEEFLQPLDFAGAFPRHRGAGAGQITQLPDRLRGNERPADQAMSAELRQPGCISHVGLAARQVLDMSSVDQQHLHPLDEASLARAQSLAGLKGYVTNLDVEVMAAADVIAKYHDL